MVQPEELGMMRFAAETYLQRGAFAEMEGVLAGMVLIEPADPWAHAALGFACHRQNKLVEAEQAYERALELCCESDSVTAVNLVAVYILRGKMDAAVDRLRRVVARGDHRPDVVEAIQRLEASIDKIEAEDPASATKEG